MVPWVARRGGDVRLVPPPWGRPAIRVVLVVAVRVGVIARREHGAPDPPQQRRGAVVGGVATLRDVARSDEGYRGPDRRDGDAGAAAFAFARRRDRRRPRRDTAHQPAAADRRDGGVATRPPHHPARERIAARVLPRCPQLPGLPPP